VDYAGLFPPASEDMRSALENYGSYLGSPDRPALGRFIVPLARLRELETVAKDLLPSGPRSDPWRLSVLVAEDARAAAEDMLEFNRHHLARSRDGHAVIDVAELKATTVGEIEHQRGALPRFFTTYFEIPHKGDLSELLKGIARVGARAKIRTGGVSPEAFPTSTEIIDFIVACRREGVAFKATAGLHHPLRGEYKLTYEADAPTGMMYGFLNVFIAAALVHAGVTEDTALAALEEREPTAFTFTGDAIIWRGKRIDASDIAASRNDFAISFGSCSFREPVDELDALAAAAQKSQ
jgi:hypothetical protein